MTRIYLTVPNTKGVGITSASLGMLRLFQEMGVSKISYAKIFGTEDSVKTEKTARGFLHFQEFPEFGSLKGIQLFNDQREEEIVENLIHGCNTSDSDVIILEGGVDISNATAALERLYINIAKSLNAEVILVDTFYYDERTESLNTRLERAALIYGSKVNMLGVLLNKVNVPTRFNSSSIFLSNEQEVDTDPNISTPNITVEELKELPVFKNMPLLGSVSWRKEFLACKISEIYKFLNAEIINEGDPHRRMKHIAIATRTVDKLLPFMLPGMLLITGGDRDDLLIAASLKELNKQKLAGIILTNNVRPKSHTLESCKKAFDSGLPVFSTIEDSYTVAQKIDEIGTGTLLNDVEQLSEVTSHVASSVDKSIIKGSLNINIKKQASPSLFRYQLLQKATASNKKIVLPEGHEPRIIEAASFCQDRGIAKCILLGDRAEVEKIAKNYGIAFHPDIEVLDPKDIFEKYVSPLQEIRKHKGMTAPLARETLSNDVMVLATMMLQVGDADGMVGGATTTTARTIMPAFQIIKTKPDASLVSSVFFMLLPDQVVVYGDCAVNPEPDANQLANIAIQSSVTAQEFGIEPKVAMISYSTGNSGTGGEVERVMEATKIAQQKCPDLLIDGPLQYDAASDAGVAKSKAPNSKVAGQATVFVFPDLNTGNTTYKAVQRSANVISIGPVLQGLNKPVNDLSRGALVNDIIYTIAITSIQA